MSEYHKILTVLERDPATKHRTLICDQFASPEFEALCNLDWVWEEKVDGTNIRVIWDGEAVKFGGKTDNAQMPMFLHDRLAELFPAEKLDEVFGEVPATLYGEGYGAKIQKGGGNYKPDGVDFVLFDVRVGGPWLKRTDVYEIAAKLDIDKAPVVGFGSLANAIALASSGFGSEWGDFPAEGLVMRPPVELLDRLGGRIITKIKTKDFPR